MNRILAPLAALLLSALSAVAYAQESSMRVTLLGTAGPEYFPERLGISTMVEANNHKLLFDIGRGTDQRLYESGINPKDVTDIFITHLHNDHIEGLPVLWMTPWFLLGRDHGFQVWGPEGTQRMVDGMRTMFSHDLEKRVNKFNPIENLEIKVNALKDGVIFEADGVVVTAFPVEHHDGNPAYGYKVEYAGHKVVLSGDTTLTETMIEHSTGADAVLHNVIAFSERLSKLPEMQGVLAKLATPEQAAEVFTRASPKMAVYTHIVTKELHGAKGSEEIIARTRAAGYTGPLTMGEDRMIIEIGDEVKVTPPRSTADLPNLDSKVQLFP